MCKLPKDTSYEAVEYLIHNWIIGDKAERDREIMTYKLLFGLTYDEIVTRYMLAHPDRSISLDTVKRTIKKREPEILAHLKKPSEIACFLPSK